MSNLYSHPSLKYYTKPISDSTYFLNYLPMLFKCVLEIKTMTQDTINVEGMSCGHCVMRIKKAIEGVQGIKKADVSLENRQAVVEFDEEKTDMEKIKAAVKEAGYEPS